MPDNENVRIAPADGKLGILIPGIGAVSTTFIAGVEAVKRDLAKPIGSLTQLATIRLGKRTDGRTLRSKSSSRSPASTTWFSAAGTSMRTTPTRPRSQGEGARTRPLEQVKEPLSAIKPMKAVFDHEYVRRIDGPNVKKTTGSKMDKAEALMQDICDFKKSTGASRLVMIWCGSTEVFHRPLGGAPDLEGFEKGLAKNDPEIAPSQIYAYAALKSGVPFANGAPNLTTDTPALLDWRASVTSRSAARISRPARRS